MKDWALVKGDLPEDDGEGKSIVAAVSVYLDEDPDVGGEERAE